MKKVLSILMIIVMLASMSTAVFAVEEAEGEEAEVPFIDTIKVDQSKLNGAGSKMSDIGSTILTIVTNVAMILAVVIIAIIGVKYMMGSIEEKAEYKKTMMPYLIGAILVFGAGAIGRMVVGIAQSL